jgi:hypothetical protein
MRMRMKIYADKRYLPERLPHGLMLYPFWGVVSIFDGQYSGVFDHYVESGPKIFDLAPLEESEVAVLPFQWEQIVPEALAIRYDLEYRGEPAEVARLRIQEALRLAGELAEKAARMGKPVAVFFIDDNETLTVPLHNAYTFRPSLVGSRRGPHEFAIPVWINEDVIESSLGGELPLRQKSHRPVVGFCGNPGPNAVGVRSKLRRHLATIPAASRTAARLGVTLEAQHDSRARALALYALSRSSGLRTNFLMRDGWFNRAFENGVNESLLRQSREEFFDNIINSDYVLCARRTGNYSIRFYETLSCGRIPILVNTDCVLPYEEWIDWKRYCVWVEESELPNIADKVLEFHERLSPSEFEELQRECRRLWVQWLSPHGFFKNFHRHFQ